MYKITCSVEGRTLHLNDDGEWVHEEEAEPQVFNTFHDASSSCTSANHVVTMLDVPTYALIGLYENDAMNVLCHWHTVPTQKDISEMVKTAKDAYVCFYMMYTPGTPVKMEASC